MAKKSQETLPHQRQRALPPLHKCGEREARFQETGVIAPVICTVRCTPREREGRADVSEVSGQAPAGSWELEWEESPVCGRPRGPQTRSGEEESDPRRDKGHLCRDGL